MASANHVARHLLITGVPGVGKTTLMIKLHQDLVKQGINCLGFITEEVRVNGRRIGFDVVTMDGQRGPLARVSDPSEQLPGMRQREYKVGQYSVNLRSFEQIALPKLTLPKDLENGLVFVIDEIGKMEIFSQSFIQAVRKLMSQTNVTIVATIPIPKGRPIPFVEELRSGAQSHVFEVTRDNRNHIHSDVLAAVKSSIDSHSCR